MPSEYSNWGASRRAGRSVRLSRQSQRDCVLQPRVARHELPWVSAGTITNPNGVAARCLPARRNPVGVVLIFAKVRAVRTGASGSLSSVRNGGEGWGEEVLRNGDTVRVAGAPLSPTLSPFVPHGEREMDALLMAAVPAQTFATIDRCVDSFPRVARSSQLWAGGRNPVGIRDRDFQNAAFSTHP